MRPMCPIASYRGEAVDLAGERVFVPSNCFARIEGSTAEIEIVHARRVRAYGMVKIARAEVYLNRRWMKPSKPWGWRSRRCRRGTSLPSKRRIRSGVSQLS